MINIKSLFAGLLVASLAYAGAAQAGEVGVSNRNSSGHSEIDTHVDFSSYEQHNGIEANWATASKDYTAKTYAPNSYAQVWGHSVLIPGCETSSEIVKSASGATSSGTYFISETTSGTTDIDGYSNFTDHTTTAFSNP